MKSEELTRDVLEEMGRRHRDYMMGRYGRLDAFASAPLEPVQRVECKCVGGSCHCDGWPNAEDLQRAAFEPRRREGEENMTTKNDSSDFHAGFLDGYEKARDRDRQQSDYEAGLRDGVRADYGLGYRNPDAVERANSERMRAMSGATETRKPIRLDGGAHPVDVARRANLERMRAAGLHTDLAETDDAPINFDNADNDPVVRRMATLLYRAITATRGADMLTGAEEQELARFNRSATDDQSIRAHSLARQRRESGGR